MSFAQIINKTAAEWAFENPVLDLNQFGREIDFEGPNQVGSGFIKMGDGVTKWSELPFFVQSVPVDLARQIDGLPGSEAVVLRFVAVRPFILEATGHEGTAATPAAVDAVFTIEVNAVEVGTMTFEDGEEVAVFSVAQAVDLAAADVLTVTAPVQDISLADISFTLRGRQI